MKRCMVAVDVQDFYKPAPGLVHHINELAVRYNTIATIFKHDETLVPLSKMGKTGPAAEHSLVNTVNTVEKYGYGLPEAVINWLIRENPDDVLVVGGHTDANVLAVGFSLFNAGLLPIMVPMLCYGNDWYMHTVTTGIWAQELGKVYESTAELSLGM